MLSKSQLRFYHDHGYLVVPATFSASRVLALVAAVNSMIERALNGDLEITWIDRERRLPARTGHMLHPDKYHPAFGDWIDQDLAPHLTSLIPGAVRHSLFGMLAAGGGQPYLQKWHRDLAKPGAQNEATFLCKHLGRSVQFNAPLMPKDHFLQIVPGSHVRASTNAEIVASSSDDGDMPDAMIVELNPGDIVYYNANLWNRGWNPIGSKRWTMHCAFWSAEIPVMQHEYGQRKALTQAGHLERLPIYTRQLINSYLDNYAEEDPPSLFDL